MTAEVGLSLFLVFFVIQLAVNLGNYTSLIYSAVAFSEISKPAFLVTFQTLGSLFAFMLLNSVKAASSSKISPPVLILLNALSALLSTNLFHFYLWISFVMVRIAFSTILVARLQALLSAIANNKEDTQHYSKFNILIVMQSAFVVFAAGIIILFFMCNNLRGSYEVS